MQKKVLNVSMNSVLKLSDSFFDWLSKAAGEEIEPNPSYDSSALKSKLAAAGLDDGYLARSIDRGETFDIENEDGEPKDSQANFEGKWFHEKGVWGGLGQAPTVKLPTALTKGSGPSTIGLRGHEGLPHSQMFPYFRGITPPTSDLGEFSDRKMELFTGDFPLDRDQKVEVENLFGPEWGKTDIFGWKEVRDTSRVASWFKGKKEGELPFEQVHVGKGIAGEHAMDSAPRGGRHSRFRISPKPLTDLRIDPAIEIDNDFHHALRGSYGKGRAAQEVYQHRSKVIVYNLNGEWNIASPAQIKARMLRNKILLAATNRQTANTSYFGGAVNTNLGKYLNQLYRYGFRNNYLNTPFRNLYRYGLRSAEWDYGKGSIANRPNMRAFTWNTNKNPARGYDKSYLVLDPKVKFTRRIWTKQGRVFGNADKWRHEGIWYNPIEWRPNTTHRETTGRYWHLGAALTANAKKSYLADKWFDLVLTDRTPTLQTYKAPYQGPKIAVGEDMVSMQFKKLDEDRHTQRAVMKTNNMGNPTAFLYSDESLTSTGNGLPTENVRFDPTLYGPQLHQNAFHVGDGFGAYDAY